MLYWIVNPWRSAFDFRGRATRREYWFFLIQLWLGWFVVAMAVTAFVDTWMKEVSDLELGSTLIALFAATFIPYLSASVRRLHDHDKSGWLYLLTVIPLVGWIFWLIMMLTPGTPGENSYGPDPRERGFSSGAAWEVFR